jgi:hypothetical protein
MVFWATAEMPFKVSAALEELEDEDELEEEEEELDVLEELVELDPLLEDAD